MRYLLTLQLLTVSALCESLHAQARIPPLDTLRAQAQALAGCYRFSWGDSIPALPTRLPTALELRPALLTALGYHRLGFFQVRPAESRSGYRTWRPLSRDSLEIELMATPELSPKDVTLSGKVLNDTLRGAVVEISVVPDTGLAFPKFRQETVGYFTAERKQCR